MRLRLDAQQGALQRALGGVESAEQAADSALGEPGPSTSPAHSARDRRQAALAASESRGEAVIGSIATAGAGAQFELLAFPRMVAMFMRWRRLSTAARERKRHANTHPDRRGHGHHSNQEQPGHHPCGLICRVLGGLLQGRADASHVRGQTRAPTPKRPAHTLVQPQTPPVPSIGMRSDGDASIDVTDYLESCPVTGITLAPDK